MTNKLNINRLKPEFIIKEIKKFYNLEFLEGLKNIPKIKIYIFGGFIRDILLDKKPKDLDIRILLNDDWNTREKVIEKSLKKYVKIQEKLRFEQDNFTVYKFLPPRSFSKNSIDLTLAPIIRQAKSDFTINDIFVDIVSGKIVDRHHGLKDLKDKRLKTVIDSNKQFIQEPWMLFRAVKFACQFNLNIDPKVYRAMKNKAKISRSQLEIIADQRGGLWIEVLLGNLFRGLNYNPHKYFEIFSKVSLMKTLIDFLSSKLNLKTTNLKKQNIFLRNNGNPFEQNLSKFLSFLVKSFDTKEQEKCFAKIINILALDEPKKFGEIVIDISKIKYIKQI